MAPFVLRRLACAFESEERVLPSTKKRQARTFFRSTRVIVLVAAYPWEHRRAATLALAPSLEGTRSSLQGNGLKKRAEKKNLWDGKPKALQSGCHVPVVFFFLSRQPDRFYAANTRKAGLRKVFVFQRVWEERSYLGG